MKVTLEISMYPLKDTYIPAIDDFIAALNTLDGLAVQTTATCTIVHGEYSQVMALLSESVEASYGRYGTSVFAVKILPGYEPESLIL